MIVVGLSGYAGAGKNSVADILVRDYGFTKMAFADPLKRMIRALDPIVGYESQGVYCDCEECVSRSVPVHLSELYDEMGLTEAEIKRSEFGPEVRRLWQRFGTDVIREMDEDFWLNQVGLVMDDLKYGSGIDRFVFTDVRFENEAEFIYAQEDEGDVNSVWRIARPDQYPHDVHISEQLVGLLGEEVTILNDGSLEDLKEPVALAMDLLLDKTIPGQMVIDIEGWEWNEGL